MNKRNTASALKRKRFSLSSDSNRSFESNLRLPIISSQAQKFKTINEEVLIADGKLVTIDRTDIKSLKKGSRQNNRHRMRICAHSDLDDDVHEMLISLSKATYIRPHMHLDKSESFHIVEGELDVVLFDSAGDIIQVIGMGDYKSGKTFYYRLSLPLFHTILIHSEILIFHETTKGPFRGSDAVFPQWAPEEIDIINKNAYVKKLLLLSDNFKSLKG